MEAHEKLLPDNVHLAQLVIGPIYDSNRTGGRFLDRRLLLSPRISRKAPMITSGCQALKRFEIKVLIEFTILDSA